MRGAFLSVGVPNLIKRDADERDPLYYRTEYIGESILQEKLTVVIS